MKGTREVLDIPVPKVGFTIDHERLAIIRKARLGDKWKSMERGYANLSYVIEELEYCEYLYRRIPRIRIIDVTHLSIEEIAEKIMAWIR